MPSAHLLLPITINLLSNSAAPAAIHSLRTHLTPQINNATRRTHFSRECFRVPADCEKFRDAPVRKRLPLSKERQTLPHGRVSESHVFSAVEPAPRKNGHAHATSYPGVANPLIR